MTVLNKNPRTLVKSGWACRVYDATAEKQEPKN
jgi:hypothetical protein